MQTRTCDRVHNVLILDNELGMGGVEKKLFDFVSRIDTSHFSVKVCCLKEGGYFKDQFIGLGGPFYDRVLQNKYDALAYVRLLKIIEDERIDLIYTFGHPNTVLFSWMARTTGKVKGLIVSFHAMGNPDGGKLLRSWQKPLLKAADRLLAVADMHKDYLVETEGLDANQITVIHNGVDAEKYKPGPSNEALRSELGIPKNETIVTTVASLNPRKCINNLLDAASHVFAEFENTRFLIVGDGQERDALHAQAQSLGITQRVTFAGIRDDIDDILRLSHIFVLPSRLGTETFPNVVLEAMASGLPVISTDVGSVREQIDDGRSGLLIPPGDIAALTGALKSMLSDPDKMKRYGALSREIVEQKFKLETMCTARENIFSQILCD